MSDTNEHGEENQEATQEERESATKLAKANEEAKRYRLQLRDTQKQLEEALTRSEQADKEHGEQLAETNARLKNTERRLLEALIPATPEHRGAPPAAKPSQTIEPPRMIVRREALAEVLDNLDYWGERTLGRKVSVEELTTGEDADKTRAAFLRELRRKAPHMFVETARGNMARQVSFGMGGQRFDR